MRAIKLHPGTAKSALDLLVAAYPGQSLLAVEELRRALAPKPLKRSVKKARKERAEKKTAKKEKSGSVRLAVWARADDRCEVCGTYGNDSNPLDFEHFFRKVNGESVEECWICCRACHKQKHAGAPSVTWWLETFAAHCAQHGYGKTAKRALAKIPMAEIRRSGSAGAGLAKGAE